MDKMSSFLGGLNSEISLYIPNFFSKEMCGYTFLRTALLRHFNKYMYLIFVVVTVLVYSTSRLLHSFQTPPIYWMGILDF